MDVVKFKAFEDLVLENSFGILDSATVEIDVEIGFPDGDGDGWYEFYNDDDDYWYAEGYLRFEDGELVDYDGCYNLPLCIQDKIIEKGYKYEHYDRKA